MTMMMFMPILMNTSYHSFGIILRWLCVDTRNGNMAVVVITRYLQIITQFFISGCQDPNFMNSSIRNWRVFLERLHVVHASVNLHFDESVSANARSNFGIIPVLTSVRPFNDYLPPLMIESVDRLSQIHSTMFGRV